MVGNTRDWSSSCLSSSADFRKDFMANMINADGDPSVTRVNHPEHYSSLQPRIRLPHVPDESVLNYARMVTTTSAATIDRQRSLAQLKRMAASGDDCAIKMLAYLDEVAAEMLKSL
jgi:hypothetical protein